MIRAGKLRHRVTLQERSSSTEADGGQVNTWSDVETLRAEVLDLRGREFLAAREAHAEVTVKVRIRYRAGVRPAMRLAFGSRVLDIVHVVDLAGRRRVLELLCQEVL